MTTGCTIALPSEDATRALGRRLGAMLQCGDCILLDGPLGAGKSALARAAIQARVGAETPVPSPTFTLVQVYDAPELSLAHLDLYRLSDPSEADELGLPELLDDGATLIEWPERLGEDIPADALRIGLSYDPDTDDARIATLSGTGARGDALATALGMPRADRRAAFLLASGIDPADAEPLAGDASNRRYERIVRGAYAPAVLMDSPPERGEDVAPFLAVGDLLHARGLSAPAILGADIRDGFLLLEDLGDALFARHCAERPEDEEALYAAAVDVLSTLRAGDTSARPPYDLAVLLREAALFTDWWMPAAGAPPDDATRQEFTRRMEAAVQEVAGARTALVLRDYHAENLIWLPDRTGNARVGLLDYQDALIGHPAYDLVSLLEDARRDVAPDLAERMMLRFLAARPDLEPAAFRAAYATLGAQRNLKIIGIFTRLAVRDAKPAYLSLIPRVWAHLEHDLAAPSLAPLREFIRDRAPAPTPERLSRIAASVAS